MKHQIIIKQTITIITGSMLLTGGAMAHPSRCVDEIFTKISESQSIEKGCYLSTPLRLAVKNKSYQNLNFNPRSVQYWQGSYSKDLVTTVTYQRELIDICKGRIIKTDQIHDQYKYELQFSVENPNLDDSITQSFMLSPMADQEAEQELLQAKQRCEDSNP